MRKVVDSLLSIRRARQHLMARIAWLGTGAMGLPMARRLAEAGHELAVWNRTPERALPLGEVGARLAHTPAEACEGAELVVTMLAHGGALEEVISSERGALQSAGPSTTFIDMSTIGPLAVSRLRSLVPEVNEVMDAPVLGSVPQAASGTLKIFVGGDPDSFERWQAMLQTLGTPRLLGPLGAGAAMKVVVNTALVNLMCTLGEVIALADGLGLDEEAVVDVLADSPIGATVVSKREHLLSGSFPARFRLALAAKDAHLGLLAAGTRGVGMRLLPDAASWLDEAVAAGLGDLDYSAVTAFIRRRPARS
jgi:3-hydroxyisobutyrate dehydrogenase-like beta-hydroxyacid dehydrogenase